MSRFYLFLCLLCSGLLSNANQLDLVFRYYNAKGHIESDLLQITASDSVQVYQVSAADHSGWQHWSLDGFSGKCVLHIVSKTSVQDLEIDVHPDYSGKAKSIVISRLQMQGSPLVLKVNHLTCKWTGGIAYPLEYRFINPLDGNNLKLEKQECRVKKDSLNLTLYVLSDSVLLFKCGGNEALFIKYYLQSDKTFDREPSGFSCTSFSSPIEQELYMLFQRGETRINYTMENGHLLLFDGRCTWYFKLE